MKITFHKFKKILRKTQEILPKNQEIFRKTQVFANSELVIVAEKRPKKEPELFTLRKLMDVFMRCVFPSRLKGNGGSQNSNIRPFLSFTLFIACFSEYAMTINSTLNYCQTTVRRKAIPNSILCHGWFVFIGINVSILALTMLFDEATRTSATSNTKIAAFFLSLLPP